MKISRRAHSHHGFTLVELLFTASIGAIMAGFIFIMLVQTLSEQRRGWADITVEERAFMLEDNITTTLRGMSADRGITPDWNSTYNDSSGNLLGYQKVFVFTPQTNGNYIMGSVAFSSNAGSITFTPDVTSPNGSTVWVSNTSSTLIRSCYFNYSQNLDSSQNNSLVTVTFQMDDNGFSAQNATNNPASIYRSFAVQMRNDN